jgi:hypothetical protein
MISVFSGKSASPLLITALLLLIPPLTITSFFPARGSEGKASQHRCGCAVEQAASGASSYAARRDFSCCSGSEEKIAPAVCPHTSRDASTVYLRVLPCGGPEDFSLDATGNKFISTGFTIALMVNSDFWAGNIHKKSGNLSLRPAVPPPEIINPFSQTFIQTLPL